jgi:hypothetical protein
MPRSSRNFVERAKPHLKLRYRVLIWFGIGVLLCSAGGYGWWRHQYPFGYSHCCDIIVHVALLRYAQAHDGRFPTGQSTPEASLSLLYREDFIDAYLLRGKTVPERNVQQRLDSGQLLTPDTCGWHYVEGLRLTDNPQLALFWDKAGLDHNGGRLPRGGHIVTFISGDRRQIIAAEWPAFLAAQQQLLAARRQ